MAEIKANGYTVHINTDITKEINKFLKYSKKKYSGLFILVDENSLRYCYPQLVAAIPQFEDAEIIEIESGEESKNIEVCTQIWSALSEYGADRSSLIINLGGGVICDMGGFIASTFKRGISFINIPTTLLSQVDASVGGKTGVDLHHIKNEIGVFATPDAVFINTSFLETLSTRQRLSGFAEVIKHALVADKEYWQMLHSSGLGAPSDYDRIVTRSVEIKNRIVMEDPREEGPRQVLNFGHTIGHAIETFSLQQDEHDHLLHGEAIAIGMVCEAYISAKICHLPEADLQEITSFIFQKFEAVKIARMDVHRLIELMKYDKKNRKGDIRFSLLTAIGSCTINKTAKADLIIESLEYYTEQLSII